MIGTEISGFQVQEVIGRGGMAIVYKAIRTSLGRTEALKVLPPHIAADPDFVLRFQREANTAALLDHPNIVRIYDFGTSGDTYYLAMQYVQGETLASVL